MHLQRNIIFLLIGITAWVIGIYKIKTSKEDLACGQVFS